MKKTMNNWLIYRKIKMPKFIIFIFIKLNKGKNYCFNKFLLKIVDNNIYKNTKILVRVIYYK